MELPVSMGKKMNKPVLGIRIAYLAGFRSFKNIAKFIKEGKKPREIMFELKTGIFQPGDNKKEAQFVTNPTIRRAILQ